MIQYLVHSLSSFSAHASTSATSLKHSIIDKGEKNKSWDIEGKRSCFLKSMMGFFVLAVSPCLCASCAHLLLRI